MTMRRKIPWSLVVPSAVLLGAVLWSLWPVLAGMAERWSGDPRYSHGYLVPMVSLALLWMRREQFLGETFRPSTWGLAFIALGAAIQLAGAYFITHSIEGFALLAYLAALALLVGGWPAFRWSWPAILFLAFMIPLPWRLENAARSTPSVACDFGQYLHPASTRVHGVFRGKCDPVERCPHRGRRSLQRSDHVDHVHRAVDGHRRDGEAPPPR